MTSSSAKADGFEARRAQRGRPSALVGGVGGGAPDVEAAHEPATGGAVALQATFAGRTDLGRRRRRNEDAYLMIAELRLAIVADGMGGRPCGDFASETAALTLAERIESGPSSSNVRDPRLTSLSADELNLVQAMHAANRLVFERGDTLIGAAGSMGTTAVAAMLSDDGKIMSVAHVGDSRCYRIRDGQLVQLTRDHSLVNEMAERAPWLSVEAIANMPKNVLTRAIGLKREVTVDLLSDAAQPGDVYLLCTDGLWGRVDADEIVDIVVHAPSLDDACASLIDRANHHGGHDNITAVLVRIDQETTRHASGLTLRAVRDPGLDEADLDWDR